MNQVPQPSPPDGAQRKRTVTEILVSLDTESGAGEDPDRLAELLPLVYDELRRLAQSFLRRERPEHTLTATAVVHEAFLRLAEQDRVSWRGQQHLMAVAVQMMRRLLVDHARRHRSRKRGGSWQRVTLAPGLGLSRDGTVSMEEVLAVGESLEELEESDPRAARVVELRFFGGLSVDEVAEHLEVSRRTVEGDWTHARAWLLHRLAPGAAP